MASRGINKVVLIGNLGNDPEVKYMPNGNAVANISIATSESWKDQAGQLQEKTEWHKVTFYKRLAEVAGEYLRKGSQIYVEGKLQTRKWQDADGNDRYTTEVICNNMQMLGGGNGQQNGGQQNGGQQNGGQQNGGQQNGGQQRAPQKSQPQNANQQRAPQGNPPQQATNQNGPPMNEPDFEYDDDIPFSA